MRHINSIVLLAAALVVASSNPSHADETGSLAGSAFARLGVDLGSHSADAFVSLADGGDPSGQTSLSGFFGQARATFGGLLRVTRFGTEVGLEGTFALGYASAAAVAPKRGGIFMVDLSGGVVAALFRLDALGGIALKVVGGIGMDQDAHYLYAGGRLAFFETAGDVAFELGYLYRVGDTYGENVMLQDSRISADFVIRDLGLTLGAQYWFGSAPYVVAGQEKRQVDQLFKGDYSSIVFTAAYSWF